MPRANRHYLPGHVWHITHRCHKQEFLLKFARDRSRWLHWLLEAKKRFGLCVLNYIVTSNHIHLLIMDTQEYNLRKKRKGAFWEDRYFTTAIDTDEHLAKCISYIDLNMVRTGLIKHPSVWREPGYNEIQQPAKRYNIINRETLKKLLKMSDENTLRQQHNLWIETELKRNNSQRNSIWSEAIAVGGKQFVEKIQTELGSRANKRQCYQQNDSYFIKEQNLTYKAAL